MNMAGRNHNIELLRGLAAPPHRAISSLRLPLGRVAAGALVASAFTLALFRTMPWVAEFWSQQMVWWMNALELPGQFKPAHINRPDLFSLPVPLIDAHLGPLSMSDLAGHGLAAVVLWWLAGWLPDYAKPGAYLLRFAVLLHAVAVVYFLAWPASFPHAVVGHVSGGLRQTWALMLVTPWLHLLTFYLFPFPAWHGALLTALTLLYLLLLAPLQYASHVALLVLVGPVLMPLLYMLFGVMVPILGIVALYGWGMSWRHPAAAIA